MTFVYNQEIHNNFHRFLAKFVESYHLYKFEDDSYRGIAVEIFFDGVEPEGLSKDDIRECYNKIFRFPSPISRLALKFLYQTVAMLALKATAALKDPPLLSTAVDVKFIADPRSTFQQWNWQELCLYLRDGFDSTALFQIFLMPYEEFNYLPSEARLQRAFNEHFMNHVDICLGQNLPSMFRTPIYFKHPRGSAVYLCLRNRERVNFATRENIEFPIFESLASLAGEGDILSYDHLRLTESPLAQIVRGILFSRSKLSIGIDGINVVIVEIDHEKTVANLANCSAYDDTDRKVPTVILKFLNRRLGSQNPTCTMAVIGKLYNACKDTQNETQEARSKMIGNYDKILNHIDVNRSSKVSCLSTNGSNSTINRQITTSTAKGVPSNGSSLVEIIERSLIL